MFEINKYIYDFIIFKINHSYDKKSKNNLI